MKDLAKFASFVERNLFSYLLLKILQLRVKHWVACRCVERVNEITHTFTGGKKTNFN